MLGVEAGEDGPSGSVSVTRRLCGKPRLIMNAFETTLEARRSPMRENSKVIAQLVFGESVPEMVVLQGTI